MEGYEGGLVLPRTAGVLTRFLDAYRYRPRTGRHHRYHCRQCRQSNTEVVASRSVSGCVPTTHKCYLFLLCRIYDALS